MNKQEHQDNGGMSMPYPIRLYLYKNKWEFIRHIMFPCFVFTIMSFLMVVGGVGVCTDSLILGLISWAIVMLIPFYMVRTLWLHPLPIIIIESDDINFFQWLRKNHRASIKWKDIVNVSIREESRSLGTRWQVTFTDVNNTPHFITLIKMYTKKGDYYFYLNAYEVVAIFRQIQQMINNPIEPDAGDTDVLPNIQCQPKEPKDGWGQVLFIAGIMPFIFAIKSSAIAKVL